MTQQKHATAGAWWPGTTNTTTSNKDTHNATTQSQEHFEGQRWGSISSSGMISHLGSMRLCDLIDL